MTPDSARCQPADIDQDGTVHYIQCGDKNPEIALWTRDRSDNSFAGYWWVGSPGKKGAMIYSHRAADAGYRYLMPVPSVQEITALVRESRDALGFMRSVMEERGDSGVSILIRALDAALAAFPAKETKDA